LYDCKGSGLRVSSCKEQLNRTIDTITETTDADLILFNIPDMADIPLINALDERIFKRLPFLGTVPVVFDQQFRPINFGESLGIELYIPLLTEEGSRRDPVRDVLLPITEQYAASGLGVPDRSPISDATSA
jgi:hypothetical protein